MKLFGVLLLVGLALAAPPSNNDDQLHVTEEFFPDELAIYTAEHDIVNIYVPLNGVNFEENDNDIDENSSDLTFFFVEADIKANGEKDYKGLYIFKDKKATRLLENGRDSTASDDSTKNVYFAATDGIYVYNANDNTAVKYGTLTDNIIDIAREQNTKNSDVLYILTESRELYKVTEAGTKKTKIEEIKNAEQFILDSSNNIYFYAADRVPYVFVNGEVRKIEGLPERPTEVTLLRPPFVIEDGIPAIVDDKSYIFYANGTVELGDFTFAVKPTAYSMEGTLVQYYARNKKIYEYNVLALVVRSFLEELDTYLEGKKETIQTVATRSKNRQTKA